MSDPNPHGSVFHGEDALVSTFVSSDAVFTIDPTAPVRSAAAAIVDQSIGMVVIGTTQDVLAVVSERDIVRAVAEGLDLDSTAVIDIGSRQLVWIDAHDTIGDVATEMMEDYVRHALVRDEDGLVGVLSMRDVLAAYAT
jgi:CBS domain-containing protein